MVGGGFEAIVVSILGVGAPVKADVLLLGTFLHQDVVSIEGRDLGIVHSLSLATSWNKL